MMQEIDITLPENNLLDLFDQPLNLDFNLIPLSECHDPSPVIETNTTTQWIWTDHLFVDQDPIKQDQTTSEEKLEDIRSARIYQQKLLEHILDEYQQQQQQHQKSQRKNSMATEPGSPLRKKKKIRKVLGQN